MTTSRGFRLLGLDENLLFLEKDQKKLFIQVEQNKQ